MEDATFKSDGRTWIFPPFAQIFQADFKIAVRGDVPRIGSQVFVLSPVTPTALRSGSITWRRRSNENPQPDSQRADPSVRPAFGLIDVDYPDSGD